MSSTGDYVGSAQVKFAKLSGQVIFRHLTEDSALVFTERQYIPAVQSYCLKLILAGKTTSAHLFHVTHCSQFGQN